MKPQVGLGNTNWSKSRTIWLAEASSEAKFELKLLQLEQTARLFVLLFHIYAISILRSSRWSNRFTFMGKKRKQAKQTSGSLPSRRQKKRRKVKGKGFNYGAKMTKEAGSRVARLNDENIASAEVKSCGTSTIFPRVTSFSRMLLLSSKLGRLSSIKNVFVLVGWLKRMFGCGLQTLGEVWSSMDYDWIISIYCCYFEC